MMIFNTQIRENCSEEEVMKQEIKEEFVLMGCDDCIHYNDGYDCTKCGMNELGHIFFEPDKWMINRILDIYEGERLSDKETCNPKICKWCKYSTNGKRDPARSISMCDGCRYNEEFEHI